MKYLKDKGTILTFRPTNDQNMKLRFIAETFKLKLSDIMQEVLITSRTLDSIYSEAVEKNNNIIKN